MKRGEEGSGRGEGEGEEEEEDSCDDDHFNQNYPRDLELSLEQVQGSRQKVHCHPPFPRPKSLIFYTRERMLSVREVLMRGRASKGGICMCVKDGGDLMVVKKGFLDCLFIWASGHLL